MSSHSIESLDPELAKADSGSEIADQENSYAQIVESSSIIGAAQIINMVVGLIRIKAIAVLVGPSGVGLLALYQSITGLVSTIAGVGIQISGVRQIANYHGNDDKAGVAKTIRTLRRVCWFTGAGGMLLMIVLATWISKLSFGSNTHAGPIAALGITILLGNIAAGQSAILQGTRRIGDLARINVIGVVIGTAVSIGFYYWLGISGIVPALISMASITLFVSTYYSLKISLSNVVPSWQETWIQSRQLVRFGIAIVVTNLVAAGVAYGTRLLVTDSDGLEGLGIYSAAYTLSAMFVHFVLGAMGADFYPRLSAQAHDHPRMTRLTNEQTEIGLLLAFPGLVSSLVLAPFAIRICYSVQFSEAAELLVWFVIGSMGQVLTWPLGYCMLAKGQSKLYMLIESGAHLYHFMWIWIGLKSWGLVGVAVAFPLLYLTYSLVLLMILRTSMDFRWSKEVWSMIAWMTPVAGGVILIQSLAPTVVSDSLGMVVVAASGIVCLRRLVVRLGPRHRITQVIRALPGGLFLIPPV